MCILAVNTNKKLSKKEKGLSGLFLCTILLAYYYIHTFPCWHEPLAFEEVNLIPGKVELLGTPVLSVPF